MSGLVIHPSARAIIVHNTRVKVACDLRGCIGSDVLATEIAEVLADALGEALADCVLHGYDQSEIDAIGLRINKAYHQILEPFYVQEGK